MASSDTPTEAPFDAHERRDPEVRRSLQYSLLPDLISKAKTAPGWAQHLADVDGAGVSSPEALATLPVLRKEALKTLQSQLPPLGGFAVTSPARLFVSPGPIYEPGSDASDAWRAARALHAAGIRAGDVVLNTFAYHLTPGGWIMDSGARGLGCTVIPAGPGNTDQQLDAIAHLRPSAYLGVPDFLKILLDKGLAQDRPVDSFARALVSGGALFPSLRAEYAERGVRCSQCYATADAGLIAYETWVDEVLVDGMIVDEGVLLEIVRPGTGDPVPTGEIGEIVVTVFNADYPLIRFATGDLSAVIDGPSPCGRTNTRIRGWLGRADQTTKIKGMFVHPEQVAAVGRAHAELGRLRLVVDRDGEQDRMRLLAESDQADPALAAAVADTLKAVTKMSGAVELVASDSLPNDGKVIADERSYD